MPGVILEKETVKEAGQKYMLMKVEVQIFNIIQLTVDFEGSENIKINKKGDMKVTLDLQPFLKTFFAKVKLKKNWNLKTTVFVNKKLPPLDLQLKYLEPIWRSDNQHIQTIKEFNTVDFTNSEDSKIIDFFTNKGTQFIDSEFPPNYESLGVDEEVFLDVHGCYMHWRKVKYIYMKQKDVDTVVTLPYIFKNDVTPTDITLSKISFCWFVSALACLAEKPFLVHRLFKTK